MFSGLTPLASAVGWLPAPRRSACVFPTGAARPVPGPLEVITSIQGAAFPAASVQSQMESIRKTQALNILPQVVTVSQAWSGWPDEGYHLEIR